MRIWIQNINVKMAALKILLVKNVISNVNGLVVYVKLLMVKRLKIEHGVISVRKIINKKLDVLIALIILQRNRIVKDAKKIILEKTVI